MPGADSRVGADRPGATAVAADPPELPGEEGLATALSAFLSQLHSGFDEDLAPEGPPLPAVAQASSPDPEAPTSYRVAPCGSLPRRTGSAPADSRATTAANRVLGSQPLKPLAASSALVTESQSASARAPAVAAWAAATTAFTHGAATGSARVQASPARQAMQAPAPAPPAGTAPKAPALGASGATRPRSAERLPASLPPSSAAAPTSAAPTSAAPAARAPSRPTSGTVAAITSPLEAVPTSPPAAVPMAIRCARTKLAAGMAAAVLLAAGLGVAVAWGKGEASALAQRDQQLAAASASLAAVRAGMASADKRVALQLRNIHALDSQYRTNIASLRKAQAELVRSEGQLAQAQGQVSQAQDQLGSTQSNLSRTQSHAALCQQGSALGAQTVQVFGSLIILQTGYLTATRTGNTASMRRDLAQMESLNKQLQAIGPKFSTSVSLCARSS